MASTVEYKPLPEPVAGRPTGWRRVFRGLWAAWASCGPVRPGLFGQAVPARDILWALPWLGLGLGWVWTVLFASAWRMFGEYGGLRLVPVLTIVVADCLLSGRFIIAGVRAVEALADREDRQLRMSRSDIGMVGALAAVVIVLVLYGLLLAVPTGVEWWPGGWRWHLRRLYPRPVFRPLVLMQMWACWSMVLACGIGRARPDAADDADPAGRIAGKATLRQIFLGFLPAAILSAVYCSRSGNVAIGLGVSLVVFVCVYVTAMLAALRWNGQSAGTILLAGLVGRTSFLLCWLFMGRAVHGW
jgi:hypothetical protein